MTRDGEIPAIFNPKRVRAPSVVVTGDSPNGPYGGFTNIINASNPQIAHQDSITSSQPDGNESTTGSQQLHSGCGGGGGGGVSVSGNGRGEHVDLESSITDIPQSTNNRLRHLKACKESCCSELAQKMYFGVCVTILVTASWVGATHCIKFMYLNRSTYTTNFEPDTIPSTSEDDDGVGGVVDHENNSTLFGSDRKTQTFTSIFNAPFFASWFCTNFCFFFFPIYLVGRIALRKCDKPGEILADVLRGLRDRGFTIGRFLNRCITFCILWVITTYLYAMSLKSLLATDVLALFATNVASVYLLSWVILHEQFVGVRIVAVILCDTGIALLAYMDGITDSPTLAGVVLSALAAAGYAVFKVMFRKVMGDPPIGQVAFTFTILGFLNAMLLWPVCVGLYLTGTEVMPSDRLPWIILLIASILLLVFHVLTQFSAAVTYNMFVTLGLITAVPVSGALDVILYSTKFAGMELAGVILIAVGFFLVMFPENWPDYITRLLRKTGQAILRCQCCCEFAEIENDNSKYHLVGSQREMGSRSPQRFFNGSSSYGHRLSHGLHPIPSAIPLRSCEMTDLSPTAYHHHQQQHQQRHPSIHQNSYLVATPGSSTSSSGKTQQLQSLNATAIGSDPEQSGSSSGAGGGGGGGGGRFLSYFGNEEKERKKSETSFFNLGFRRKSTIYYAATD